MKTVLIISAIIILVHSAALPKDADAQATVVKYDNKNDGKGNYEFSFVTSNGILRSETGRLVNIGQPDEHIEVKGVVTYTDPDGKFVIIRYTANKNGYQVTSDFPIVNRVSPNVVATLLGK